MANEKPAGKPDNRETILYHQLSVTFWLTYTGHVCLFRYYLRKILCALVTKLYKCLCCHCYTHTEWVPHRIRIMTNLTNYKLCCGKIYISILPALILNLFELYIYQTFYDTYIGRLSIAIKIQYRVGKLIEFMVLNGVINGENSGARWVEYACRTESTNIRTILLIICI